MNRLTRARRLLLAGLSLGLAYALFHGQLATAIVTRGDDALRGGDVDTAIRLYRRAMALDPQSTVAPDRLAFHLALGHGRDGARAAVAIASRALAVNAAEPDLFVDRAFAELQLRAWPQAERDFDRAGTLAHDPRYEHFAGRMALRLGNRAAAKRHAQRALADDPTFAPARAMLRTLE